MENNGLGIIFGLFAVVPLLISLALCIVSIIGLWKVFEKAGETGWHSLIPVYNSFILFKITFGDIRYGFTIFASCVPIIGPIVAFFFAVIMYNKLSQSFDKGIGFTFGLVCLFPIFIALLGLKEENEYLGPIGTSIP